MEKKIFRVKINTSDEKAFTELVRDYHLDMAAEHREKDGKIVAEAYVPSTKIEQIKKEGVDIKVIEDAVQTGNNRRMEVSSQNTFARADSSPPRGFGKKE